MINLSHCFVWLMINAKKLNKGNIIQTLNNEMFPEFQIPAQPP